MMKKTSLALVLSCALIAHDSMYATATEENKSSELLETNAQAIARAVTFCDPRGPRGPRGHR